MGNGGIGSHRMLGAVAFIAVIALLVGALGTAGASSAGGQHTAAAAKKCKKKKKGKRKKCKKHTPAAAAPVVLPTPLALTEPEVSGLVDQRAAELCAADPGCFASGHWAMFGPGMDCSSKETYTWACFGYIAKNPGDDVYCLFREIVERSGYNGLVSHRDLSYGTDGWSCYLP
jgi:hypothetical protein